MNTNVITNVAWAEICDTKYKNKHSGPVGGLGTEFLALSCSAFPIYSPVPYHGWLENTFTEALWRWANTAQHGCTHPSLCLGRGAEWSCHQTAIPSHQGKGNKGYGHTGTGNLAQRG